MPTKPVIFFDGVCNLCNQSVVFVIERDPKAKFVFAPLQSSLAQYVLKNHQVPDSIVLFDAGKVYVKSSAALRIARQLSGAWPLLYAVMVVPRFFRDGIYDWIARNRYRWFGKKDVCMIPTAELSSRFIA